VGEYIERVVVIGGGQAGARAAQAMRVAGYSGVLTIVAEETHPPYQRPPLSKAALVAGEGIERVRIHAPEYYGKSNVEVIAGNPARAIDREACTVELADGRKLPYDRLLIATGARVRRIAVPGSDKGGVLYLRTLDDALALRQRLVPGARVVVIGGGFIGLEVAASARTMGCEVTVLESADRLMGRALAREIGDWFAQLHRAKGVDVRTGVTIERFDGDDMVSAVVLGSGERIPADTIVVGIGIVPNVELAQAAGLAVDNGIVVDEHCRTSDPRIYAAGDVTSQPHPTVGQRIRLESYQNAQDQGSAAGRNLIGTAAPHVDRLWVWTDQHGINLQVLGVARPGDTLVYRGDPAGEAFIAFYLRDRRIVAVNAINMGREIRNIEHVMKAGVEVDPSKLADPGVRFRDMVPE
jgi:3-phenylpropionate/trans-cinnamate dioxygenase ferredoxin reductase subunit